MIALMWAKILEWVKSGDLAVFAVEVTEAEIVVRLRRPATSGTQP